MRSDRLRTTAVRGRGAWCDGGPIRPTVTTRGVDSVVAVSGMPARVLPWKQFRALGSAALTLCDVAAGRVDGFVDTLHDLHAPWDYLGGLLVCTEAGADVVDVHGRELGSHRSRRASSTRGRRDAGAAWTRSRRVCVNEPARASGSISTRCSPRRRAAEIGGRGGARGDSAPRYCDAAKAPGDWVSDVDTSERAGGAGRCSRASADIAFFGEEVGGERAACRVARRPARRHRQLPARLPGRRRVDRARRRRRAGRRRRARSVARRDVSRRARRRSVLRRRTADR